MNTATQPPPRTELADRFRCESEVPDPPSDPAGRKQYWEDTVAEAVAELRRRLASTRDEKSFQALQMILDLEKTRLRHKAPVAGTETGGGYSSPLPPLEPRVPGGREPKNEDLNLIPPAAPATLSGTERVEEASRDREGVASSTQAKMPLPGGRGSPESDAASNTPSPERGGGRGVGSSTPETEPPLPSYPFPPKPAHPIPMHIRVKLQDGIIGHFHDHDHDDDWMLERGRRRRKCDTKAEVPEEIDLEAVRRSLPPLPPLPGVKNFDLFSLRPEAPSVAGPATASGFAGAGI